MVVGYDTRYGSHVFARTAAEVFAGAGVEVTLLPAPTPTQLVPYLVKKKGLDGGVMITASHNPASYNGYKVYGRSGSQIRGAAERAIEEGIWEVTDPLAVPRVNVRPTTDQQRHYIEDVVGLVDPGQADLLRVNTERAELKIAYTPLHGVGGDVLRSALQTAGFAQTWPVTAQLHPDPTFPTLNFPNPQEPGATDLLLDLGKQVDADILIALDPDADRCAIGTKVDGEHRMLTADELGPLLATRIVPEGGRVAASAVSSQLLALIAKDRGWQFTETLTGFKNLMSGPDLDFAYEEADGISPAPRLVADKDGIATALVTCAWAAELRNRGGGLADELAQLHRKYGVFLSKQFGVRTSWPEDLVDDLRRHTPETLVGLPVNASDLPEGQGVRLVAEGSQGSVRAIARLSGTESLVKVYLEVSKAESRATAKRLLSQLEVDAKAMMSRL